MDSETRTRIWPSPIDATLVTAGSAAPGEIRWSGDAVYWAERRPDEGGRVAIMRGGDASVPTREVTGATMSARTRVHEYGGGAWAVAGDVLVTVDDARDGQVVALTLSAEAGDPRPLTPAALAGADPYATRYADLCIDPAGGQVYAVRERHLGEGGVVNDVVALALDGSAANDPAAVRVVAQGADFYGQLALEGTGDRLAFIRWMLPAMPWDATELVVVDLNSVSDTGTVVAGGPSESVVEPAWSADGSLLFCSDRTGWWNPYRLDLAAGGEATPVAPDQGEIGGPMWVFGNRSIAELPDGRLVAAQSRDGTDHLVLAVEDGAPPVRLESPFTHISQVVAGGDGSVLVVAGTPQDAAEVWQVDIDTDGDDPNTSVRRLREPGGPDLDPTWWSVPAPLSVHIDDDTVIHAIVYPPTNPDVDATDAEGLPPLLVLSHGGPTSAARVRLDLTVQYWTSRGFCVADVNYRGSTGYGRSYREALYGRWGDVDVVDCAAVAEHLAATGVVDPERLGIRGGSAGGFTTLAALCFTDTFSAGMSAYGIADLAILAADTHKFESRYLDQLVGPWPEDRATYEARSPIHHLDGLNCPVGILQGAEDAVVPPSQAEAIVEALRAKRLPYAALTFPDEGHGFRRAENIVRSLEAELWFFARAFDLHLHEDIEPVPGEGL